MADRNAVAAHQDLLYQEAHDLLTLRFFQSVGSGAQPYVELGESFHQAEVPGLIGGSHFQRL